MEQSALASFQTLVMDNARNHRSAEEIIADEDFKAPFLHELRCYAKNGAQTRQLYIDESYDVLEANEEGLLVSASATVPDELSSASEQEEQKVLLLHCEGPVTRSGGMCSYGSIDYRNLLQEYAEDPSVSGMVFLTDTPGGDAMAMYDFEDGMRAWKAAGKRSVQLVDGNDFSAGEAMGCQCDYQIAVNHHNGFGCIGAMVSGFITPANSENTITHERFLHVVAEQTPDKNAMWEKAANGDTEEVQAWVSESAQDFLDMMHKCRPNVNDEHLTGKTYEAGDVLGSLCDGIGTIDDAIHYCLTGEVTWQSGATETPAEVNNPEDEPEVIDPETEPENDPDDPNRPSASSTVPSASPEGSTPQQTILTPKDMTLLKRIAAALGIKSEAEVPATEQTVETPAVEQPAATVEEPEVTETTAAVAEDEQPAATVEEPEVTETTAAVAEDEQPAATVEEPENPEGEGASEPAAAVEEPAPTALEQQLTEQIAQYDSQITELQNQLQEQVDVNSALAESNTAALAAKDETIAQHVAEIGALQSKLSEKEAEFASVSAQLSEYRSLLAECKAAIEQKDAELATLNEGLSAAKATIAELEATAPAAPAPAAPAAKEEQEDETPDEFKEDMTAQEMIAVQQKRTASRRKKKA